METKYGDNIVDVEDWFKRLAERLSKNAQTLEWKRILMGSAKRCNLLKQALTEVFKTSSGLKLRPDPLDIFAFTDYVNLDNLYVIILGQDPYPNDHACGLSFSSLQEKCPDSLRHVLSCVGKSEDMSYADFDMYDLRPWCRQGVLLLNSSLTTVSRNINHIDCWKIYVEKIIKRIVIKTIDLGKSEIYWLLWGKVAEKWGSIIEQKNINRIHKILEWGHPSPLNSANSSRENPKSFYNCDHFDVISAARSRRGLKPIIWGSRALSKVIIVFVSKYKSGYKYYIYAGYGIDEFHKIEMQEELKIGEVMDIVIDDIFSFSPLYDVRMYVDINADKNKKEIENHKFKFLSGKNSENDDEIEISAIALTEKKIKRYTDDSSYKIECIKKLREW